MKNFQLIKKIIVTGKLTLKTGLHIGGTNSSLNIGGPDKFVVRNPVTSEPYIPGSSLKGKMRSLIEMRDGTIGGDEGPTHDANSKAGSLFGALALRKNDINLASRLIVRDAPMDPSCKEKLKNTDMPYTESKTEVSISRTTSSANPRTFERVPAGAVFNINMVINIFVGENEAQLVQTLKDAMGLLEMDYLGGNGSRGYGQVEFSEVNFVEKQATDICLNC